MNDSIRVGQGTLPTMQNTCIKNLTFLVYSFFWGQEFTIRKRMDTSGQHGKLATVLYR